MVSHSRNERAATDRQTDGTKSECKIESRQRRYKLRKKIAHYPELAKRGSLLHAE